MGHLFGSFQTTFVKDPSRSKSEHFWPSFDPYMPWKSPLSSDPWPNLNPVWFLSQKPFLSYILYHFWDILPIGSGPHCYLTFPGTNFLCYPGVLSQAKPLSKNVMGSLYISLFLGEGLRIIMRTQNTLKKIIIMGQDNHHISEWVRCIPLLLEQETVICSLLLF